MAIKGLARGNTKRNLAKFPDIEAFFKSWGMYTQKAIDDDDLDDDLNPEVIEQGINRKCYEKLIEDADRQINASHFPNYFSNFCRRQIDATDDQFYLTATSWGELKEAWKDYIAQL
jgi:hypothetical protein